MNNFIKSITVALDKLTMLSLKFVSNSLRNATALASNHIGSSVGAALPHSPTVVPTISATKDNIHDGQHFKSHNHVPISRHARFIATSPALNLAAMSESKATNVPDDLNLPLRPKKPITPWLLFVKERKDEVLGQKAKMTAAELSIILAKDWKVIDRSKYEAQYKVLREQYLNQMKNYENSLTDEHRDYLKKKKNLSRETKALREIKKTDIPRMPRNPANFYCSEKTLDPHLKQQLKSGQSGAVFSELFKEYKLLSDAEKKKYIRMQDDDKDRFAREFQEWFKKVTDEKSGHSRTARKLAEKMRTRFQGLGYL